MSHKILSVLLSLAILILFGFSPVDRPVTSVDRYLVAREMMNPIGSVELSESARSLVSRFQNALAAIDVSVRESSCRSREGTTLYGTYNDETKELTLCEGALQDSRAYVDTLVHESWHTVQDCLDGMDNSGSIALSQETPELSARIISDVPSRDLEDVRSLYAEEKQLTELEARYMEKHPEVVLSALKICARRG